MGSDLGTNARPSCSHGSAEMGVCVAWGRCPPPTSYGWPGWAISLATANSSLSAQLRFGRLMAQG